jgi:2-aminoadipate transaminase
MIDSDVSTQGLPQLSSWARGIEEPALQRALAATTSGMISLAPGIPDSELFPLSDMAAAAAKVLATHPQALQYAVPCPPLKELICAYMAERGVKCTPDCILLTQGAQQALTLLAQLLLDPGRIVLEEELSYSGFQHAINAYKPEVVPVRTSVRNGVDLDALEQILKKTEGAAFMYVMADAHNPLGISLSLESRQRLAYLARKFQTPLIEDDPYGELFYTEERLQPVKALDDNWVYYIGSFSKVLCPSLRVGWIVAEPQHIRKLSIIKEGLDLNINTYSQWIVYEYLETGKLHSHIKRLRTTYCARRDAMDASLRSSALSCGRWVVPSSGIFFWIDFPSDINTTQLLSECLKSNKVAFIPSEACSRGKRTSGIRLNFSRCVPSEAATGIARIGDALQQMLNRSGLAIGAY